MKAKVIKTGEMVDVYHESQHGQVTNIYKESVLVNGRMWSEDELDFCRKADEAPQKIKVMKQYIDKSALVAELERLISNGQVNLQKSQESNDHESYVAWAEHIATCIKVLSSLDTLEVKEVDLNKEISQFIDANFEKATIGHKLSLRRTAKHFFELGLKTKGGINYELDK